jgi:hypothetical protein
MSPTQTHKRQLSDRPMFRARRFMFMFVAATLLVAAGSASAQLPALPVNADARTDISTPFGSISAAKQGQHAQACAQLSPSIPSLPVALPVALPVQLPSAAASACANADLDRLTAAAGADVNAAGEKIEARADTGSITEKVKDKVSDVMKTVMGTLRGLL